MRTNVLGDREVFETVAGAASQRDPAEALDLQGLHTERDELERAPASTDDVDPAALQQGEREDYLTGALASKQREVGEVGAGRDGAVDHGVEHHGADDLQHPEPVQGPHEGERDIEGPPETHLLEARGDREAVELALHVGGGVDPQFEYAQRGAPRREPARQQGDGEGAVDDELLEPRRGADHPADGLVGRLRLGSAGGGLEGAPREVERGEVRHAVAPASRDAGAGRDVPGFAHLREDVLHDAVRERVHADALHPWRRRDAIGVKFKRRSRWIGWGKCRVVS
jgi:hypothetical protein